MHVHTESNITPSDIQWQSYLIPPFCTRITIIVTPLCQRGDPSYLSRRWLYWRELRTISPTPRNQHLYLSGLSWPNLTLRHLYLENIIRWQEVQVTQCQWGHDSHGLKDWEPCILFTHCNLLIYIQPVHFWSKYQPDLAHQSHNSCTASSIHRYMLQIEKNQSHTIKYIKMTLSTSEYEAS